MPIKPELRYFYPIDWPQISHWVRFVRAKGRCQVCGRPHGETVQHLGDGRWWDETDQTWRDGRGRKVPSPALAEDVLVRTTKVVLAAAHLDHDPAHCGRRHRNVRALCQRCHLLHDRPEHRRRIRLTLRRRRALGDLFSGPYSVRPAAGVVTESPIPSQASRRGEGADIRHRNGCSGHARARRLQGCGPPQQIVDHRPGRLAQLGQPGIDIAALVVSPQGGDRDVDR